MSEYHSHIGTLAFVLVWLMPPISMSDSVPSEQYIIIMMDATLYSVSVVKGGSLVQ